MVSILIDTYMMAHNNANNYLLLRYDLVLKEWWKKGDIFISLEVFGEVLRCGFWLQKSTCDKYMRERTIWKDQL